MVVQWRAVEQPAERGEQGSDPLGFGGPPVFSLLPYGLEGREQLFQASTALGEGPAQYGLPFGHEGGRDTAGARELLIAEFEVRHRLAVFLSRNVRELPVKRLDPRG